LHGKASRLRREHEWHARSGRGRADKIEMIVISREMARSGLSADRRVTIWSVLTGIAGQAALLLSGPLVARMLGVEHRGYLALLLLVPTLIPQIAHLGLPDAIPYHLAGDIRRLRAMLKAIRRTVVLQICIGTFVGGLVLVPLTMGRPAEVRLAGFLSIPLIACSLIHTYGLAVLQGIHEFTRFQWLRLAPLALYTGGAVCLFFAQIQGLVSVMLVCLIAHLITVFMILLYVPRGPAIANAAEGPTTMSLLRFGIRGWLGTATPSEALRLDQVIVGLLLSPSSLGLFVIGGSFSNLPRFIAQSVGLVTYPRIAAESDRLMAVRSLTRHLIAVLVTCGTAAIVLGTLCGVIIPIFFGREFVGAIPVTQLLLIASVPSSARRVLGDGLRGLGRPGVAAVAEIVTGTSLVVGLLVLVPILQIKGAAVAVAVSALCGVAVMLVEFRRLQSA
jgi:O-antigen/teichoic acid export membrane protein